MEVSGKELQHILTQFIKFSGIAQAFHGTEKQIIDGFIETYYPALWNEKMRNS